MRAAPLLLATLLGAANCSPDALRSGSVGTPAPDYAAAALAGDSVSLASLRGEVVLLNVWATWCAPCRREVPELQALHEAYAGRGLNVLGVSVDAAGANEIVRTFADEFGVTYRILRDPGERVSTAFRVQGIPTTVLIDRDGMVRWRHIGPVTTEDPALQRVLAEALAQ